MKGKWISLWCLLAMFFTVFLTTGASAENHGAIVDSGQCGDTIYWTLYEDGRLDVSGSGRMADYKLAWGFSYDYRENSIISVLCESTAPWASYSDHIKTLALSDGITEIGTAAFAGCSALEDSLTLPNSIRIIRAFAFMGCSGLSGPLILPEGLIQIDTAAFFGCSGFSGRLVIPETCEILGGYENFSGSFAFTNFEGIVRIPQKLINISWGTFAHCGKLLGFEVADGNEWCYTIDGVLYTRELITKNGELYVAPTLNQVPAGKTGPLVIPQGIERIGEEAAAGCSQLTGMLILPDELRRYTLMHSVTAVV